MLTLNSGSRKKYLSFTFITTLIAAATFAVISACTGSQAKAKPNIIFEKQAPAPGVVAQINGENITEDELIGDDKLDFYDLRKHEYDLKMDRLNRLILEKMVGAQAKDAGMSLEDYINKKVVGGEVKISESEYKKFIKEKNVPESQLTPQLKERIMAYLQQLKRQDILERYISKLTAKNPVLVYFDKPRLEVPVVPGNGPWFGGEHAAVTIVEFSDFQCPFCGRASKTVDELKKEYGDRIKFYYRQFPLPMHPNARPAAEASMCVFEQGRGKFWKFHDLAFSNQDKLDQADLAKYAEKAGANPEQFEACFKAKKYTQQIQADIDYGEKIGVKSTPTFFINGQIVNGAVPIDQFQDIINDELASAKK